MIENQFSDLKTAHPANTHRATLNPPFAVPPSPFLFVPFVCFCSSPPRHPVSDFPISRFPLFVRRFPDFPLPGLPRNKLIRPISISKEFKANQSKSKPIKAKKHSPRSYDRRPAHGPTSAGPAQSRIPQLARFAGRGLMRIARFYHAFLVAVIPLRMLI